MNTSDALRGGFAALILASASMADGVVAESRTTFDGHGKPIGVEVFAPTAEGKHPAIVMLHGSGGMLIGGEAFRAVARELAKRDYVVLMVHYFDRTGTKFADPKSIKDNFTPWVEIVGDAVGHAAAMPNVDPDRIGLVGFSLGAYLSLSEAVFDPRVKGVVEFFGGLPATLADKARAMPPTLILHGEADKVVPVSEARDLERLLKDNAVPFEIQIYPESGHAFLGDDGLDSLKRTLAFLDKHVKGP